MKKIGFIYINKSYGVYHSLSIAIELAKKADYDVHLICTNKNHSLIQEILKKHNCQNITIKILRPYWYFNIPHYFEIKFQLRPVLFNKYAGYFKSFDAFVCTMYEDLLLKKIHPISKAKFIFTNHGIANRAYSFDSQINLFDFIFLLGQQEYQMRQKLNQLTPFNHRIVGFYKYDLVGHLPKVQLFQSQRPTIIYNPHWDKRYTSYYKFGQGILDFFANQQHYNLIFAPHSILLERDWSLLMKLKKYQKYKNILIDFGSEQSNNMTYTNAADLYLGDISSQAFEFVYRDKRPCLFIDAHQINKTPELKPISWSLGNRTDNISDLAGQLQQAFLEHKEKYQAIQAAKIEEMFNLEKTSPSELAATAIEDLMKR